MCVTLELAAEKVNVNYANIATELHVHVYYKEGK